MTPWESLDSDPAFKGFVVSRGWTADKWNASLGWERGAERVEFNGGLQKTGILRELPGAVRETVSEQAAAVGSAVTSTGRFLTRTLFLAGGVGVVVAAVVYRAPLLKIMNKGKS